MNSSQPAHSRTALGSVLAFLLATLLFTNLATPAKAQQSSSNNADSVKVFHLNNVHLSEINELAAALRNMLAPTDKVYVQVASNNVLVAAPPDQIALAGRLIAELDRATELDRPKGTYRLTFTLNEADNGKRIGVQHFSLVTLTGQHTILKQGDKIPVITGSFSTEQKAQQTQFTYLDIGMNLDITLDEFANGLRLRSRVEQSSVATEASNGKLADDPIVRQSLLEGTSVLTPGKPLTLGSLDIVGSTRHIDIEVVAEPIL